MQVIDNGLKLRFCKDAGIPIRLVQEPYFTERMELFDRLYDTKRKWSVFQESLQGFNTAKEYLDYCDDVANKMISDIKKSDGYQRFIAEPLSRFAIPECRVPSREFYKDSNAGKVFVSIDMSSANFEALKLYDSSIFAGSGSWNEFAGKYTGSRHLLESKSIRQRIFGHLDPKRQGRYQKFLMYQEFTVLEDDRLIFFSNDELVFDVTDLSAAKRWEFFESIKGRVQTTGVTAKVQLFHLLKIEGISGYERVIIQSKDGRDYSVVFKGVNSLYLPSVVRLYSGEDVQDSDLVFWHEGTLCKIIEVPVIQLPLMQMK